MKSFKIAQGPRILTVHNYSVVSWTQANQVFELDEFADSIETFSFKSRLSIAEICRDYENQKIDTSPREYQREKVAKLKWRQDLILTVLTDDTAFVPEIHIRVIRFYNQGVPQWKIELLDGQQRTTTLIRFRRDEFPLPQGIDAITLDGQTFDVAGKKFSQIPQPLQEKFNSYMLFSSNYVNISDAEAAHLFIDVLNNTNEMNPQEKRNAERGPLAQWVRNTARFDDTRHELFERVPHSKNKDEEVMKYFAPGFGVGRMQSDEWSCTQKQRYVGLLQWDNKKALGQFKSLFGGKNKNAMNTIRMVLVDYNMDNDNLSEWGIVKVDSRRTFSAEEIERKWIEQGCKCYYTGEDLDLEECVGDHGIPWSWGIERGGVTDYGNLIVTSEYHNTKKSDKYTATEYLQLLEPVAA